MINLCLSNLQAPADFYFCSSVSAAVNCPSPVAEDHIGDPSIAAPVGYSRSKWIGEQITLLASQTRNFRAGIHRIGQLVGDSQNGVWNQTEAISLTFKSAQTIGILPDLVKSHPSWLPVDKAAEIIIHLSLLAPSATGQSPIWHIVNPNRQASWRDVCQFFRQASKLSFTLQSPSVWLSELEKSDQNPVKNPSIRLLQFFRDKYEKEQQSEIEYSCTKTAALCPQVRQLGSINLELMERCFAYWKQIGFF